MRLRKWDERKKAYEPYDVPDEWHVTTFESDMNERVNCAQCGREISFGDSYTSMQVHSPIGFGYAVCEDCYHLKEWPERVAAEEARR